MTISSDKPQWPTMEERPKVKEGFTKALTRSAREPGFRGRLLDFTKQQSVKDAVQEELNKVPGAEKMVIPPEIMIIFYERQEQTASPASPMSEPVKDFFAKNENRNLHVFFLPDFNPNDTAEHKYDTHLVCCYRPW